MVKDFHHFKGHDLSRAEKIQRKVAEVLLKSSVPDGQRESSIIWELKHSSGCCQIGRILGQKRNLDVELAELSCLLHDIAVIAEGSYADHARRGAEIARNILLDSRDFTREEIALITEAIASHSEKQVHTNNPYVELVKDADVFDCSLYENAKGFYLLHKPREIYEEYVNRIRSVRRELGLDEKPVFREEKIVPLEDFGKADVAIAGGKGAQLGELINAGFSVPDGFVITTAIYKELVKNGIGERLRKILTKLDVNDANKLENASQQAQSMILDVKLPKSVENKILKAHEKLGGPVAVRSSATAEDMESASFAGQQDTLLNVKKEELIDAVKRCMASLFMARAIWYREQRQTSHPEVAMAIVVQKMVNAQKAGVAFSLNPVTGDASQIVIEATAGLGEAFVSGTITPDTYVLSKETQKAIETHLNGKNSILTAQELIKLVQVVRRIEAHYHAPQDIEWAIDQRGELYVLQARPVTTLHPANQTPRWKKILSREYGVQYTELSLRSLSPESSFAVPTPLYEQAYVPEEKNEACYIQESSWNAFVSALKERYVDNPGNYDEFEKLFMETGSDYAKTAEKIAKSNLKGKSNRELGELYRLYQQKSLRYAPFIWIQFIINNFYSEKANGIVTAKVGSDSKRLYDFLEVALVPGNKAAVMQLNELASRWGQLDDAEKNAAHERFKWMPCLDIHDKPWSSEEFFAHVADLKRPQKKLSMSYNQMLRELKPDKEEKNVLRIAKRLSYLKDLKDDFRRQGVFHGQALLSEIATRMSLQLEDVSYLLEAEISGFLDWGKKVPEAALRDRKAGFAVYFTSEKEIACKSGKNIRQALDELGLRREEPVQGELRGQVASPGRASGTVKIVRGISDLGKITKGDILVAVTTHPDYVPAMQKAAAIVTDEGGITSHAAIVAREMALPCIVGVKSATKVLKDGDFVEVNATTGSVRKVS